MLTDIDKQQKNATRQHVIKHKGNGIYLLQNAAFGYHNINGIKETR